MGQGGLQESRRSAHRVFGSMRRSASKGCCRSPWRLAPSRMATHERLEAWRVAHALALEVFAVSDRWPKSEQYILTSQIRRAALSIPANIAEGAARQGRREFARFLNIALGSLAELRYLLRFSLERRICSGDEWERLGSLSELTAKRLYGLYRRVRTVS